MKLTNEEKARYFAGYLGQEVFSFPGLKNPVYLNAQLISPIINGSFDTMHLLLRSHDSLTDEELINCTVLLSDLYQCAGIEIKISRGSKTNECIHIFSGRKHINKISFAQLFTNSSVCQYLQQIGVALPFLVIRDGKPVVVSVEDLVEQGVIKIKE